MKLIRRFAKELGLPTLDAKKFARARRGLIDYVSDKRAFYKQYQSDPEKAFPPGKLFPCLEDRLATSGTANGHYFHQDLLVAQMVYQNRPRRHVDVGSRVDGFIAHVAAFREIDVLDIRPLAINIKNIRTFRKDLMSEDADLFECTDSLSCLHTLEHFGLGRYGDPIDYNGYKKGFASLINMLEPGGRLYFSVPIGKDQRFEFNAHRVFCIPFLLKMFANHGLVIGSFHYVDDAGDLNANADVRSDAAGRTFNLRYGCGIFALQTTRQEVT
jgi:hypothetical protein